MPSRCSASVTSRCSGSSCGLLCCCASSIAAATASRAFPVYLFIFIAVFLAGSRPRSRSDSAQLDPEPLEGPVTQDVTEGLRKSGRPFLQSLERLEVLALRRRQLFR